MSTDTKPAASRGGGRAAKPDPKLLLKQLLEGHLAMTSLQNDYQDLYRNLPAVLGIAAEIMKRKEAGDRALEEGMEAVERILSDAKDKAAKLSDEMMAQHEALGELLKNKASLTELLKAGLSISPHSLDASATGLAGAIPNPNPATQINTMMDNLKHVVASEVERHVSQLRGQIEQAISRQKLP